MSKIQLWTSGGCADWIIEAVVGGGGCIGNSLSMQLQHWRLSLITWLLVLMVLFDQNLSSYCYTQRAVCMNYEKYIFRYKIGRKDKSSDVLIQDLSNSPVRIPRYYTPLLQRETRSQESPEKAEQVLPQLSYN